MEMTALSKGIIEAHSMPKKKSILFEMALGRMPSKYIKMAQKIDGDAYTDCCFAFEFKFLMDANRYVIINEDDKEAYYMDEDGNKHWMDYKIPKNVYNRAVEQCNAHLKRLGIKKERIRKERKTQQKPSRKPATNIVQTEPCSMVCVYDPDLIIGRGRKYRIYGQMALF